ncbi:MAG TPA: ABC transporter permease subunit [Candidatus Limiplasma sp.]|nr:ABC transporter permease subunit [Candidatus Limiplasma sp.]
MNNFMQRKSLTVPKLSFWKVLRRDFIMNKYKYLLMIPVLIILALFAYKPMYGLVIAFQNYRPRKGIAGSDWVGLQNFINFFLDPYFPRLIRNTLSISILTIIFGFPTPIIFALLLNELRSTKFKRTVQTITYMPYFISLVVVCSLIKIYCQSNGLFSQISVALGGQSANYLSQPNKFYLIYVVSDLWQTIGWNSIIYLAALSSIDQEQYEAARIDGANRFQQIRYVTLPGLSTTITVLFILRMGSVLNVGFEKILLLYSEPTYSVADVISTYVYRRGIIKADYSYATAVGLFNSIVNVFFLVITNALSKRYTQSSLF